MSDPGLMPPGPGEPDSPASTDVPDEWRAAASSLFGPRLDMAVRYAERLGTDGVVRGLIGPREVPRLWDRHLLNCAAMAPLVPPSAYVVDVGSGAGLPGIVLAIARPDIDVVLIEPLARRTSFLDEVVLDLDLADRVLVLRGRAEDAAPGGALMFHVKPADVVTARAVAPLDRLVRWCLPLVAVGGRMLALKGASAADEIAAHMEEITRWGGGLPIIHACGADLLTAPTTVVEVRREREAATRRDRGATGSVSRPGRSRPPRRD